MSLELDEVLILPSQWHGRPQRLDHQNIQLTVLIQALQDKYYCGPVDQYVHDRPDIDRAEAEEWIASDAYHEFSFRMCCENNGIDPDALREKLAGLISLDLPVESPIDLVNERPTVAELLKRRGDTPVCSHGHPVSADTVYVTRKRSDFALRCLACARERTRARAEDERHRQADAQGALFAL